MNLSSHFPEEAREMLLVRGKELLDTLGLPALRSVVTQVLCGVNIRNATESLTHRRISLLNAALLQTYTNFANEGMSANDITDYAFKQIRRHDVTNKDKIVLRWMLGLTQKQVQNVLRSDDNAWKQYVESLKNNLEESANSARNIYGEFPLSEKTKNSKMIDWSWGLSLLMAVGSQTLATRGSEKSLYGKFFEKMIMGSVLSVLGFELASPDTMKARSFMLSSTSKRESDATAIWKLGEGVRFDIGFIGRGNPEITLDKVTRFEREEEIAGKSTHLKTFIIVDVVGPRSSIIEQALRVDGVIIQMSSSNWVKTLGNELESVLSGFVSPVKNLSTTEYSQFIEAKVKLAPIEKIFQLAIPETEEVDRYEDD